MVITPKTLIYHCLIGLEAKIVQSSNPQYVNINGKVIDETKNTLIIEIGNKEIQIPKRNSLFQFRLSKTKAVEVDGISHEILAWLYEHRCSVRSRVQSRLNLCELTSSVEIDDQGVSGE